MDLATSLNLPEKSFIGNQHYRRHNLRCSWYITWLKSGFGCCSTIPVFCRDLYRTRTMSSPKLTRHGSCLCGKVQVHLTGEPERKVLCHCLSCQKSSGVVFEANVFYRIDVRVYLHLRQVRGRLMPVVECQSCRSRSYHSHISWLFVRFR